jgi:hypothetical protein
MKKTIKFFLIIIFFVPLFSNLYGQDALNKGVYSLGGSAQYSSSSESEYGYTYTLNTGNISPQFTYFIANHISIGAAVNYVYYYSKEPGMGYNDRVDKSSYITFGPIFRYYFNTKKVIPFLEASFNYSIYGIESLYPEHAFNYGIKSGLEIFLSKSVALEPSIGYSHIHYTMSLPDFSGDSDNFDVGIGVSYFIF